MTPETYVRHHQISSDTQLQDKLEILAEEYIVKLPPGNHWKDGTNLKQSEKGSGERTLGSCCLWPMPPRDDGHK